MNEFTVQMMADQMQKNQRLQDAKLDAIWNHVAFSYDAMPDSAARRSLELVLKCIQPVVLATTNAHPESPFVDKVKAWKPSRTDFSILY